MADWTRRHGRGARPGPFADLPRVEPQDYDGKVRRAVVFASVIWQATLLLPMLALVHHYRVPAIPVAVWLVMLAGGAPAGYVSLLRPLSRGEAAALVAVMVVSIVAVTVNCRGYDVVTVANYPPVGVGWLLAMVAASRPRREWIVAGVVVSVTTVVAIFPENGADALAVSRFAASVWGQWIVLVSVASMRAAFQAAGSSFAAAASDELALAAEREATEGVLADRQLRYRQLAHGALPLVRKIAAGRVDLQAADLRRQCALEAAALRRSLVGGGRPTALSDLLPVVEAAERRGVIVDVQANGRLGGVPASVREEIARHVAAALERVSDGRVLLTAMCQEDAVDVYLTYPAPTGSGPDPPPDLPPDPPPDRLPDRQPHLRPARCTAVDEIEDGRGVLEVRWSR